MLPSAAYRIELARPTTDKPTHAVTLLGAIINFRRSTLLKERARERSKMVYNQS